MCAHVLQTKPDKKKQECLVMKKNTIDDAMTNIRKKEPIQSKILFTVKKKYNGKNLIAA